MIPIIDAGHGSRNGHLIVTPGKRSPFDEHPLVEGEFNRAIAFRIIELCELHRIPYHTCFHTWKDYDLHHRAWICNEIYEKNPNVYTLSIHANGGGGEGVEVYTSPGETRSDPIASLFKIEYKNILVGVNLRSDWSDGDWDKEEKLYMLTRTRCPAVLTENGFMDHRNDVRKLRNPVYRDAIAKVHFNVIKTLWQKR